MLDSLIYLLLTYNFVITALLFVVKIVLFFRHKNKNWKLLQFLYFNQINIKFTANTDRVKLKRIQNGLSVAILIMLVIQVVTAILFR